MAAHRVMIALNIPCCCVRGGVGRGYGGARRNGSGDSSLGQGRGHAGGHLRSKVCRQVRRASGAAMAVAPDGPRLLALAVENSSIEPR